MIMVGKVRGVGEGGRGRKGNCQRQCSWEARVVGSEAHPHGEGSTGRGKNLKKSL